MPALSFSAQRFQRFITGLLLLLLCSNLPTKGMPCPYAAITWKTLDVGLMAAEIKGPFVSNFSDSKVTVLKIDPAFYSFEFQLSTQFDSIQRTACEWCELTGMTGAINAGMYSLKDHVSGTGYLANYGHINNPVLKDNFNALALFNPCDPTLKPFRIIDTMGESWQHTMNQYHCCLQSLRMIDEATNAVYWHKKPMIRCSMTVLAIDRSGQVLMLFVRSPYTANEFIDFMLQSGLGIKSAMYLEGGPEATLYVKVGEVEIEKFGSYVSYSNPNDDNAEVRKMPNVLGFRKKRS
jgi:hypothetical protein